MKKIGIIGSRRYSNSLKIKEFIFKVKEKFGNNVEIISGGQKYGADGYAKKYALLFEMKYVEFPPAHYPYNQFCIEDASHFNKPYKIWHYFERNKKIANYSDYIVAFIPKNIKSNGTMHTITEAKKLNKKVIIVN